MVFPPTAINDRNGRPAVDSTIPIRCTGRNQRASDRYGHEATVTTQNKENDPVLLKRGIIYLILWLILLWQMWPKFTSFVDAGVINVFNQQLQGNYAIIALIVLVLICVALCAIGLKDIFIYVRDRPEDEGDDN